MCASGIDHTPNGYYSSVLSMRTIFCLRQVRDEPTEVSYRRFEAAISTAKLEKCNAITHIELNKYYADGDDEDGTKTFQEMCIIMSTDLDQYSGIWNNLKTSTLLGTENYTKTKTAAYNVLCCHKKPAPPRQVHAPPAADTFVQSSDTDINKTKPGNGGRYFPEVT